MKVNGKIEKALIDINSSQSTLCHRLVSDNTTEGGYVLGSMVMLNVLEL